MSEIDAASLLVMAQMTNKVNQELHQQLEQQWISVEDRLPEPDVKVLAHCIGLLGRPFMAVLFMVKQPYYNDPPDSPPRWVDEWVNRSVMLLHGDIRVTHWMPLPEPPK